MIKRIFPNKSYHIFGNLMIHTAADLNDDIAWLEIGQLLALKNNFSDKQISFSYIQKSANLGNDIACCFCGFFGLAGLETKRNNSLARDYFLLGSDFGNSKCFYELAKCYLYGVG
jgi:TPR repeat protein